MHLSRRFSLLCCLALIALLAAPAATAELAVSDAAAAVAPEDVDDLVKQVKKEKDKTDPQVFKAIARHGDLIALKGLEKAAGYLKSQLATNNVYGAMLDFRGKGEVEEKALDVLLKVARKHKREEHQRAATRALTMFGPKAHEGLRLIAETHKDPEVRARAVQAIVEPLAAENSTDAAQLLIDNARLRFAGQRAGIEQALRAMQGEELNALFGRHVEDSGLELELRLLLFEVLADREDPQVDDLVLDLMNAKDGQLLVRAVEAAGARRLAEARPYLLKLGDSREDHIARAAIFSLGQIMGQDGAWQEDVFGYAGAKRSAQRMGAAAALGLLRNGTALARLHEMLRDPERNVRIEALQSTGNLRQRESIPVLIQRLGVERGRIHQRVATILRLFTGLDLGSQPVAWQRWWDKEGEAFPLPTYEEALKAEQERDEKRSKDRSRATFYGLQVVSDRVVFVLDVSGSMERPARGRGDRTSSNPRGSSTRLAVAQEEIRRVLTAFPNGNWFNLIFFAGGIQSWLDELEEMDDDTREEAIEYLYRQRAGGGTAIYDALERAFEDEQIDTIYLLSDGDPSAGKIIDPGRIRFEVQRWNAIRKVQINTISIGQASQLLRWLAQDTGGEYVEVR